MSFRLTRRVIKLLCGPAHFATGERYCLNRKISFQIYDAANGRFAAEVKFGRQMTDQIHVTLDQHGDVQASCSCGLARTASGYCQHIAAVLLAVHDQENFGDEPVKAYAPSPLDAAPPAGEQARAFSSRSRTTQADAVLELFSSLKKPSISDHHLQLRQPLKVEFICQPYSYREDRWMFGIEIKAGPQRLYIVQNIREFLRAIETGKPYVFTRQFTYDPRLHNFTARDEAVLKQLIQSALNERLYRETVTSRNTAKSAGGERMLLIPPAAWERLLPELTDAPSSSFEHEGKFSQEVVLSYEPLPLRYEFSESEAEGFQLHIEGLDAITVMTDYQIIIANAKLYRAAAEHCRRLSELQSVAGRSPRRSIPLTPEQMQPFMDKVVPELMKMGRVQISQSVSERMVHHPLQARLYLDRIKSRLLAGLEFQYGDLVLNPLEENPRQHGEHRILVRDGQKEQQILQLMETASFGRTEAGYFMESEDAEFDFLYHTLPQLEKLMQVYATTAVKNRLYSSLAPPKVRINLDQRRNDWLEFSFQLDGIPEKEIKLVIQSLMEKRRYYRMANGALMPLETEDMQNIVHMMNELGIRKSELGNGTLHIPVVRGLHLLEEPLDGRAIEMEPAVEALLQELKQPALSAFPVPEQLQPILREYQVHGYQWMKTLARYKFGGILADDMGLGKTLQSITYLASVLDDIRASGQPALIVCPSSLVYNWQQELKKFTPHINAVVYDGGLTERRSAVRRAEHRDVVITSYPLLRMDAEFFAEYHFHTVFLDEAQTFKNHTTQTAQAVRSIQGDQRFALTGTPVENALEELWSIFHVILPVLFPGRKAFSEMPRSQIAAMIRPFLLRRLKTDVLKDLPDKIETVQATELLPEQKKLYAAYLARLRHETLKHLDEEGFQKTRIKILAGLTRLRQLCCHPALFVEGYSGTSAKFEQLMELIEECRSAGKRMLIFSQFTGMLGIISRELGFKGIPHFYLDGSTPSAERVEMCDRFNQGEHELFLISLKAGGTGLNLTGADTVILYDLWWNPAVEQQAADRAHRMGQTNVVQVIRMITHGTVEDKMYELQQSKKNLIEEVIAPGEESQSSLTEEEIRSILSI
ncbi:DEAD/DEAH box helicase [Paenibacillus sp. JX-17]|uniref:DEAD/DEAH box helicase n=1 Tax=Paenibacillus lacisoli TaxID=3064525 RepID=A0ABT9C9N5_9BACL|nr:DEAD/DEAH box helicase [Paenibacillus sp. JX-17]MDO7905590.1 DEAD/DEAH box helicase [Paenibacillus sp. JX-17]